MSRPGEKYVIQNKLEEEKQILDDYQSDKKMEGIKWWPHTCK